MISKIFDLVMDALIMSGFLSGLVIFLASIVFGLYILISTII